MSEQYEDGGDKPSGRKVRLFHYGHGRAWFDTKACREGFREDRRAGLIYGPYWLAEHNRFAMSAEEMSALTKTCPYCGAKEGMLAD